MRFSSKKLDYGKNMSDCFDMFIFPYLSAAFGAAYALLQNLDGLDWLKTSFPFAAHPSSAFAIIQSHPTPTEVAKVLALGFFAYIWILAFVFSFCGYLAAQTKGFAFTTLLVLMPGVFGAMGLLGKPNFSPDVYSVGKTGYLGSPEGTIPIVLLGLVTGWCVVVFLADTLGLGEKFRHWYDHFWYSLAILGAVFFVHDSQTNELRIELDSAVAEVRNASQYLVKDLVGYLEHCKKEKLVNASCVWAESIQWKLNDYSYTGAENFVKSGPEFVASMFTYSYSDTHIQKLRRDSSSITQIRAEIERYNSTKCPVTHIANGVWRRASISSICRAIPLQYCMAFFDDSLPSAREMRPLDVVAISSDCVIPILVKLRAQQEKLVVKLREQAIYKNFRWMFLVSMSIVAGGKVANASGKLLDLGSKQTSGRAVRAANSTLRAIKQVSTMLCAISISIFTCMVRFILDTATLSKRIVSSLFR
jgi:hypothetical protein